MTEDMPTVFIDDLFNKIHKAFESRRTGPRGSVFYGSWAAVVVRLPTLTMSQRILSNSIPPPLPLSHMNHDPKNRQPFCPSPACGAFVRSGTECINHLHHIDDAQKTFENGVCASSSGSETNFHHHHHHLILITYLS